MVLAKSSRDINQKEAIANFEFTVAPRALFSPDGTILQCRDKSKLIHLLNKLPTIQPLSQEGELQGDGMATTQDVPSHKIALVDAMVLLQQMTKKPATIVTVKDLSECFNNRLMSLTRDYDEIILVFDTYQNYSLKSAARDKITQGRAPIQYQVRGDTNIKHIPMNRFLSHDKTKADLTHYLAAKILEYNKTAQKRVITSSSGHTSSNDDLHFQDNNQLDPLKNGYHKDSDGQLKSKMTDALPAPKAIIEMVTCHCKTDCSSARCSCRTNNLSCSDLCRCGSECQNDEDTQNKHETDDDDDDDDL